MHEKTYKIILGKKIDTVKIDLVDWLEQNTKDCCIVVEFGSMFFEKLGQVHQNVKKKIGIEIFKPYIDNAKFHDCVKIQGDMRDFSSLVPKRFRDCAMFIDSIEHIEKKDAVKLLKKVQKSFDKIILMTPDGFAPQDEDFMDLGAEKYQTHRSQWSEQDLVELGFQEVNLYPKYHFLKNKYIGCLLAVWKRGE